MRIIRFGSNGWRARFDDGFDDEAVVRIAGALGRLWSEARPGGVVLVGFDTRHDGARLACLLGEVVASFGLQVKVSEGPCPTPAIGWCACSEMACVGAVMLTASDSPCEYGGVLLRGEDGGPVTASFIANLDHMISARPTQERGQIERCDFIVPYVEHLLEGIDVEAIKAAHLSVVVDPMHGSALAAAHGALECLGCEISFVHGEPMQDFGGLHPKPVEPWVDECEVVVRETKASCGICLDGDGDRAALIDERGRLVSRHDMVPLVLKELVEEQGNRGRVVVSKAASVRVQREAEALGCPWTAVPIGFERIYSEALEGDVILGADEYGGVCVPWHLMERDGLYAALLCLERMAKTGAMLSDMVAGLKDEIGTMSYGSRDVRLEPARVQSLRNLLPGVNPRSIAGKVPLRVNHADGLGAEFEDDAWVLVRVSRTESVARIYAEASSLEERDALINDVKVRLLEQELHLL